MTKFLLAVHVLAAIVAIGPVAVAASMFPAVLRRGDVAVLRSLNRICRVYAAVGVAVPFFGLATAGSLGVLGDTWLIISIALTAVAAVVLVLLVLPQQHRILADGVAVGRLAMYTGLFNLLWAAVTVLMIVRPGSTTGA
ncbi:hypothetical protein [Actinocrispum sp. NPDC049592]|uniref:hypothetical protein n=1 Tax=Actinocrispum sp. NPDC049592 TaxID=3154835 RepID=UPI00343C5165